MLAQDHEEGRLEPRKERARQFNQTLASVAQARTPIDGMSSAHSHA